MNRPTRISILIIALATLAGCASRYKVELFQTADEVRRKVKVEETKFIPGTVLGDPNSPEKFVPGTGNTMIVTTGTRGQTRGLDTYAVIRFDEYLRCDIYFELAQPVALDTIDLADNSFLWIKGRYDQPPSSRLFMPDSGRLIIDSIAGGRMYATVDGVFRNGDQVPLRVDGNLKVKISD